MFNSNKYDRSVGRSVGRLDLYKLVYNKIASGN